MNWAFLVDVDSKTLKFDEDIKNSNDNLMIISGKNCSGKSTLIGKTIEHLKLNHKYKVYSLMHSLGFQFNKKRLGNENFYMFDTDFFHDQEKVKNISKYQELKESIVKYLNNEPNQLNSNENFEFIEKELNFLTIKYNGKEKDYPDKFLDELLYKLVVLKTYNLKPIQLFSYIFFIYEKLSLKSLGFEEPLNFLNNLIQKEFPEGLKSIRLQKIESDGIVMGLKIDKPSSGVILLINILILKYIHTQYSEIDLILMDEPDRHFEPELIEYFFNIINNSFKNTRVIITTHRPDSIALAPQGSLWTIRIENDGQRIIKRCNKINALFELTYNLRAILNFKIRVYVESHDDFLFYETMYRLLYRYCNILRENKVITNDDPLLSRRYQLEFCSSAKEKNGNQGGYIAMLDFLQRDISSFHLINNNLSFINFKNLWNSNIVMPYALRDDDNLGTRDEKFYQKISDFETNNGMKTNSLKERIFRTKRYSIENFIYDPIFICSCFNDNKEFENFFKESNIDLKDKLGDCFDSLKKFQNNSNESTQDLQNKLDIYFDFLFNQLYNFEIHEKMKKYEPRGKMFDYFLFINKDKLDSKLQDYLSLKYSSNQGGRNRSSKNDSPSLLLKAIFNKNKMPFESIITEEIDLDNSDIKEILNEIVNKLCNNVVKKLCDKALIDYLKNDKVELKYRTINIENKKFFDFSVEYPNIFLKMKGHLIEYKYVELTNENYFLDKLTKMINASSRYNICFADDLAKTLFELNEKVKMNSKNEIEKICT